MKNKPTDHPKTRKLADGILAEHPEIVDAIKPKCKLTGTDGNVFSVIGIVSAALKKADQKDKAAEFTKKAFTCTSYDEVLRLCFEYVNVR